MAIVPMLTLVGPGRREMDKAIDGRAMAAVLNPIPRFNRAVSRSRPRCQRRFMGDLAMYPLSFCLAP